MEEVTQTRTIALADNQALSVTLQIGNAQRGGTVIRLQRGGTSTQLARANVITRAVLGSGATLRGGVVQIITVVVDVNPDSDWTNVTHILTAGSQPTQSEDFHLVAPSDHLVRYTISYQIT